MNTNSERFFLKIVDMYYKDELSQEEIGKKLNISRTTVSRALTRAKSEGYVKIVINYPSESPIELEKAIEKKYGMKEVIVAMTKDEYLSDYLVPSLACEYLLRVLRNNMTIGVTWGRTMRRVVDNFNAENYSKKISAKGIVTVPFLGSTTISNVKDEEFRQTYSNIIATKLAELVKGMSFHMPAPTLVSNSHVKEIIENEPEVKRVLDKAKKCDIALLGIGALSKQSSFAAVEFTAEEKIEYYKKMGGVGEIVCRIYDGNGNTLKTELNDKAIGISLEDIKKIPTKVGIAYGLNKISAIKGALKGQLINVLITDSFTAKVLAEE